MKKRTVRDNNFRAIITFMCNNKRKNDGTLVHTWQKLPANCIFISMNYIPMKNWCKMDEGEGGGPSSEHTKHKCRTFKLAISAYIIRILRDVFAYTTDFETLSTVNRARMTTIHFLTLIIPAKYAELRENDANTNLRDVLAFRFENRNRWFSIEATDQSQSRVVDNRYNLQPVNNIDTFIWTRF